MSNYRPEQPIIAATPHETVMRQLLLHWGVFPVMVPVAEDSEAMTQNCMRAALDTGVLKPADKVVMMFGMPIVSPIVVNTIRVIYVGNVLARGANGGGINRKSAKMANPDESAYRVTGRVVRAESLEDAFVALRKKGGEILVVRNLDMSYVPILRLVDGLVIENPTEMNEEILSMINPNLVWISQVPESMKILEPGFTVTVDSREKLVYEGTI